MYKNIKKPCGVTNFIPRTIQIKLKKKDHYSDAMMGTMASQITSLMIVYSTVYSGADQRKHQTPRHWPLCVEFTGDRRIPHTKGKTRKRFPFDDVTMCSIFRVFLHEHIDDLVQDGSISIANVLEIMQSCTKQSAWWSIVARIEIVQMSLQWRHKEHDIVSNHQPHDCSLNRLFRRRSKKTSKLRDIGLCEGNSPVAGEFLALRASNVENISIWWRHHAPVLI